MRAMHGPVVRWELIVAMVLIAAIVTWGQHRARAVGEASLAERGARAVVWPVQSVLVGAGGAMREVVVAAYRGRSLVAENEELEARVRRLEADRLRMVSYYLENTAMRKKLGWAPLEPAPSVAARVIDWSSGQSRKRVAISANRELELGNIVRTEAGLVGRVIEAQGTRGTVMLLNDAESAVAVRVQREDGDFGMVSAAPEASDSRVTLKMVPHSHRADLRLGDVLVSSGDGGVYPQGVPIGFIESVETSAVNVASITAYIHPFADFEHLDYVLVERRGE